MRICGAALIRALALLPDREPADHDDEHDQRSLDHLRVVLVDARRIISVFTSVSTNAAAIGPIEAADAAEQRDAAEHDRGDGVERVDVARVRVAETGRGA